MQLALNLADLLVDDFRCYWATGLNLIMIQFAFMVIGLSPAKAR